MENKIKELKKENRELKAQIVEYQDLCQPGKLTDADKKRILAEFHREDE